MQKSLSEVFRGEIKEHFSTQCPDPKKSQEPDGWDIKPGCVRQFNSDDLNPVNFKETRITLPRS